MVGKTRKSATGFTLIELVIAIAIVGILAAIAVPSYTKNLARGNRAVAQRALTELVARQEGFFLKRRSYATAAELLGDSAGYSIDTRGAKTTVTANQVYAITMSGTGATYMVTATAPTGSKQAQRDPQCLTFSLGGNGSKSSTPSTTCWSD